jgi:prevent-host-death family protein
MLTVSAADARKNLSDILNTAVHEPVLIQRRGAAAAVVVGSQEFDRLIQASQEAEDVAAFDQAMAEDGMNLPWEQAKADLGWV